MSLPVANLIRELREARSLFRPRLSPEAKLARAHLWAIETGRYIPGIAILERISDALGIGLSRFLTKSDSGMLLEDPFVRCITALLPRLNLEHRQLILKTLEAAPRKILKGPKYL